ncbi:RNA-binding cell elongation regulator Jag/EloR [Sporosalibacterium faouarense]|uniref:RNA-binding cell elongation regulator Jag/EloR n=1 Tax=Sporosalibacterium faouarense TaxID=516123 RepID=UPI00141D4A87|nr:RNA-binding cell elongation regulator Jag/EloR [Sporosalibacterium faouarense]MTI49792.1 protein jag [Bacillota bacterium]
MKSVVKTSKTVEEAIEDALAELDVEKEDTSIEVLEEPSKGLFGLIGTKDAKVRVTVVHDPIEITENFLNALLNKMQIKGKIKAEKKGKDLHVEVEGVNDSDMGILIGKRGNTLDSIQYLLSLAINRDREKYIRVLLDSENYRKRREETLIRLAKKMASKVKATKRRVKLEPMNPYERRIIHSTLQKDYDIETHSEGEEPYRKVVIEYKNKRKF